jgi:hypothetical protein
MLAYSAYKKYKERRATKLDETHYDGKLSESSDPPSESMLTEAQPPKQDVLSVLADVDDKKERRKQWIALGISLFVDIVLPIVLYVSFFCPIFFGVKEFP